MKTLNTTSLLLVFCPREQAEQLLILGPDTFAVRQGIEHVLETARLIFESEQIDLDLLPTIVSHAKLDSAVHGMIEFSAHSNWGTFLLTLAAEAWAAAPDFDDLMATLRAKLDLEITQC